ncbi:hypothetical protein PIB30_029322 [Stylosanthes scabra]|uniref:Uncharacterized protein n=1 Tax=Stylosanthes scabra TaxID=79078 RepID=A0ABU6ZB18_9FABA|nr:hypothetical protein [Stylosanthes scabra]
MSMIYRRLDSQQEESRKSFEAINTRMDRMDDQLSFLCYSNQMINEQMHFPYQNTARQMKEMEMQRIPVTIANLDIHKQREEEMNQERIRHNRMVQETTAERAREANKGKARTTEEADEDSEELASSASEECIAWSFIPRGNDTHFTVVLLVRFGALLRSEHIIYYEYEKREKFEDYDMKVDAELGNFKIRHYHFDDESFVHPLHSVRFDPDHLYEIPIEVLMADKILSSSKDEKLSTKRPRSSRRPTPHYSPGTMSVAQRERSTSSVKGTRSFRRGTTNGSFRKPRSWEFIVSSEGWMCEADDKKEIGGTDPSKKEESSEEDLEMEEEEPEETGNPKDRNPATPSLTMDIDAEEDYQRYIEELGRAPEPFPLRSSQASVPDEPVETADRQSVSHDGSSYNLSGVWKSQSLSPSS